MQFFGLSEADYEEENTVYVWPENVQAINAFIAMGTQWRVGFGGAYGLDYSALKPTLELMCVPAEEWPHIFEYIRVCEDAALEQMRSDD